MVSGPMNKTEKFALQEATSEGYKKGYADAVEAYKVNVIDTPVYRLAESQAKFFTELFGNKWPNE